MLGPSIIGGNGGGAIGPGAGSPTDFTAAVVTGSSVWAPPVSTVRMFVNGTPQVIGPTTSLADFIANFVSIDVVASDVEGVLQLERPSESPGGISIAYDSLGGQAVTGIAPGYYPATGTSAYGWTTVASWALWEPNNIGVAVRFADLEAVVHGEIVPDVARALADTDIGTATVLGTVDLDAIINDPASSIWSSGDTLVTNDWTLTFYDSLADPPEEPPADGVGIDLGYPTTVRDVILQWGGSTDEFRSDTTFVVDEEFVLHQVVVIEGRRGVDLVLAGTGLAPLGLEAGTTARTPRTTKPLPQYLDDIDSQFQLLWAQAGETAADVANALDVAPAQYRGGAPVDTIDFSGANVVSFDVEIGGEVQVSVSIDQYSVADAVSAGVVAGANAVSPSEIVVVGNRLLAYSRARMRRVGGRLEIYSTEKVVDQELTISNLNDTTGNSGLAGGTSTPGTALSELASRFVEIEARLAEIESKLSLL